MYPEEVVDLDAEERQEYDERSFRNYNFVIFSYTAVMTCIPFIGDTYGDAGAWCWIDNSTTGKVWRFLAFYIPVWFALITMSWMYYTVYAQKLR